MKNSGIFEKSGAFAPRRGRNLIPAYNAGLMNKGSRIISGTTDIEKGTISLLIDKKKNLYAGYYPAYTTNDTRGIGYIRIEAEAGGAARRIYPNTIRDNRRRDGREGE